MTTVIALHSPHVHKFAAQGWLACARQTEPWDMPRKRASVKGNATIMDSRARHAYCSTPHCRGPAIAAPAVQHLALCWYHQLQYMPPKAFQNTTRPPTTLRSTHTTLVYLLYNTCAGLFGRVESLSVPGLCNPTHDTVCTSAVHRTGTKRSL
jgi:hypothetical protein